MPMGILQHFFGFPADSCRGSIGFLWVPRGLLSNSKSGLKGFQRFPIRFLCGLYRIPMVSYRIPVGSVQWFYMIPMVS